MQLFITEEGIIQATAGYPVTINCSVSSGIPNETMIWNYNNIVVAIGGPAFISYTFSPARKDHLKNLTICPFRICHEAIALSVLSIYGF
jgi:hypothetical protein